MISMKLTMKWRWYTGDNNSERKNGTRCTISQRKSLHWLDQCRRGSFQNVSCQVLHELVWKWHRVTDRMWKNSNRDIEYLWRSCLWVSKTIWFRIQTSWLQYYLGYFLQISYISYCLGSKYFVAARFIRSALFFLGGNFNQIDWCRNQKKVHMENHIKFINLNKWSNDMSDEMSLIEELESWQKTNTWCIASHEWYTHTYKIIWTTKIRRMMSHGKWSKNYYYSRKYAGMHGRLEQTKIQCSDWCNYVRELDENCWSKLGRMVIGML